MGVSWESLGLLEALLGSFKSEKMPTVPRENHLFVNAVFWLFAALMALLGSSWSVLGGFGSRMGFPKFSNMLSKVCQKMIEKRRPWRVPERVPKRWKIEIAGLRHFLPETLVLLKFIFSFSLGFGALWLPLGSLLGSLEALLGSLWTQKRVKTKCFLMVLKRLFFGL